MESHQDLASLLERCKALKEKQGHASNNAKSKRKQCKKLPPVAIEEEIADKENQVCKKGRPIMEVKESGDTACAKKSTEDQAKKKKVVKKKTVSRRLLQMQQFSSDEELPTKTPAKDVVVNISNRHSKMVIGSEELTVEENLKDCEKAPTSGQAEELFSVNGTRDEIVETEQLVLVENSPEQKDTGSAEGFLTGCAASETIAQFGKASNLLCAASPFEDSSGIVHGKTSKSNGNIMASDTPETPKGHRHKVLLRDLEANYDEVDIAKESVIEETPPKADSFVTCLGEPLEAGRISSGFSVLGEGADNLDAVFDQSIVARAVKRSMSSTLLNGTSTTAFDPVANSTMLVAPPILYRSPTSEATKHVASSQAAASVNAEPVSTGKVEREENLRMKKRNTSKRDDSADSISDIKQPTGQPKGTKKMPVSYGSSTAQTHSTAPVNAKGLDANTSKKPPVHRTRKCSKKETIARLFDAVQFSDEDSDGGKSHKNQSEPGVAEVSNVCGGPAEVHPSHLNRTQNPISPSTIQALTERLKKLSASASKKLPKKNNARSEKTKVKVTAKKNKDSRTKGNPGMSLDSSDNTASNSFLGKVLAHPFTPNNSSETSRLHSMSQDSYGHLHIPQLSDPQKYDSSPKHQNKSSLESSPKEDDLVSAIEHLSLKVPQESGGRSRPKMNCNFENTDPIGGSPPGANDASLQVSFGSSPASQSGLSNSNSIPASSFCDSPLKVSSDKELQISMCSQRSESDPDPEIAIPKSEVSVTSPMATTRAECLNVSLQVSFSSPVGSAVQRGTSLNSSTRNTSPLENGSPGTCSHSEAESSFVADDAQNKSYTGLGSESDTEDTSKRVQHLDDSGSGRLNQSLDEEECTSSPGRESTSASDDVLYRTAIAGDDESTDTSSATPSPVAAKNKIIRRGRREQSDNGGGLRKLKLKPSSTATRKNIPAYDTSSDEELPELPRDVPVMPGENAYRSRGPVSESSDDDDFESFLHGMKQTKKPKKKKVPSMEEFIVEDDEEISSDTDEDAEDDGVFYVKTDRLLDSKKSNTSSSSESEGEVGSDEYIEPEEEEDDDSLEDFQATQAKTPAVIDLVDREGDEDSLEDFVFKTPKLPPVKPKSLTCKPPRTKPVIPQPQFGTPQGRPLTLGLSRPNSTGHATQRLGFLRSLSTDVEDSARHPEATRFVRHFKKVKEDLCRHLFKLYNETIFEKKLSDDKMIIWNSRLTKTAGYCVYRRDPKIPGGRDVRIELSVKVCDSTERVRDTLVHELCHAAVWLLEGERDGHGPLWKYWARRANLVHSDLPVIKRCHSYSISTKYTYRCTSCGYQIGRHSKSLDTKAKVCGYCRSPFELLVNARTAHGSTPQTPRTPRTPNRFALFVKDNYGSVKQQNKGIAHKDVMGILSADFAAKNKISS